jgi:hypothetical protein
VADLVPGLLGSVRAWLTQWQQVTDMLGHWDIPASLT